MGEDRGQQRADLAGVDPLARLLEVDAEPEVVLDLDEQVGQPDRAVAGVQPAVQLGEAVRLRRGRAARPCPSSAAPSRKRSNASDRRAFRCSTAEAGSTGNPVRRPERVADLLPLRGGQEEGLEPAEVLRALDGEVAADERPQQRPRQLVVPLDHVQNATLQLRQRTLDRVEHLTQQHDKPGSVHADPVPRTRRPATPPADAPLAEDLSRHREYERNHAQRYADGIAPPVSEPPPSPSSPRLRRVK